VTVAENDETTRDIVLVAGPPSLPGFEEPPQDIDGDGLYKEI